MSEELEWRFSWRAVDKRPTVAVEIKPASRALWPQFRLYHYMSAALVNGARCYALYVNERLAAFAATLHFPHPRRWNIWRVYRVVVLPDWQGLGLGMALIGRLGGAHRAVGHELRIQTASAVFGRVLYRSSEWKLVASGFSSSSSSSRARKVQVGKHGGKFTIGFRYVGSCDPMAAAMLLGASNSPSLPARGSG